jgi:hypothetical protein
MKNWIAVCARHLQRGDDHLNPTSLRHMNVAPSRLLPMLLTPDRWRWLPPAGRLPFWVGEDSSGTRWLIKCRGGFRSVRERAFSLIAQELGISCQSSTFLMLPQDCPPFLSGDATDIHQLAILLLDEHETQKHCDNCPLEELKERLWDKSYDVDVLSSSKIANAIDIARGEMLGMLCEMYEPPGRLITRDHVFVQIDNELMFSRNAGANLWESVWVKEGSRVKPSGLAEAIRLCERILLLRDEVFREALALPPGYKPKMNWNLRRVVDAIRPRARRFLQIASG